MAFATEIEQEEPGIAAVPAPKKRGRPRKVQPVDPDGSEIEEGVDDSGDLWIHLLNLTPDEWDKRLAYLIRLAPTAEARSGQKGVAVCTFACAFDRDKIMKEQGSGVYRLDLLIQNEHTGKYTRYRQKRFDIMNYEYPPNMPYGEWIDRPENSAWKWAGPMLLARESEKAATLGVPGPTPNPGSMYPPGFNINTVYDKAFDMAKMMIPTPPPPKDDTVLTTLLTKLLDASLRPAPTPPPPDNSAMERIFQMQKEQNDRMYQELKELREKANAPAPPPRGIKEQIEDLAPTIDYFVDKLNAKNGDAPWYAGIAKDAMEQIPEVIQVVNKAMTAHQYKPSDGQPATFTPQLNAAPNAAPNTAQPQPTPQTAEAEKQAAAQKWAGHINYIGPQMIDFFKTDKGGHGGYYFRDAYLIDHGRLKWIDLRAAVGVDGLQAFVTQHPHFKVEMVPVERAALFVKEFFTNVGEEEDAVDEQPPVGDGVVEIKGGAA